MLVQSRFSSLAVIFNHGTEAMKIEDRLRAIRTDFIVYCLLSNSANLRIFSLENSLVVHVDWSTYTKYVQLYVEKLKNKSTETRRIESSASLFV
jgi:hypothetical protein